MRLYNCSRLVLAVAFHAVRRVAASRTLRFWATSALLATASSSALAQGAKFVAVKTQTGCEAYVHPGFANPIGTSVPTWTWSGACIGGQAEGRGILSKQTLTEYMEMTLYFRQAHHEGRPIGYGRMDMVIASKTQGVEPAVSSFWMFHSDGMGVSFSEGLGFGADDKLFESSDVPLPRTVPVNTAVVRASSGPRSSIATSDRSVMLSGVPCSLHKDRFPDCGGVDGRAIPYTVYSMRESTYIEGVSTPHTVTFCPDPRSMQGCSEVADKISAPYRQEVAEFINASRPSVQANLSRMDAALKGSSSNAGRQFDPTGTVDAKVRNGKAQIVASREEQRLAAERQRKAEADQLAAEKLQQAKANEERARDRREAMQLIAGAVTAVVEAKVTNASRTQPTPPTQAPGGIRSAGAQENTRCSELRANYASAKSDNARAMWAADISAWCRPSTENSVSAATTQPLGRDTNSFSALSTGNVCVGETLQNGPYESAMAGLSKETTLQLRGAIVGIDLALAAHAQCGNASAVEIRRLTEQRNDALRLCRQISATDLCLVSPF